MERTCERKFERCVCVFMAGRGVKTWNASARNERKRPESSIVPEPRTRDRGKPARLYATCDDIEGLRNRRGAWGI